MGGVEDEWEELELWWLGEGVKSWSEGIRDGRDEWVFVVGKRGGEGRVIRGLHFLDFFEILYITYMWE